jgi:hypothetical protein
MTRDLISLDRCEENFFRGWQNNLAVFEGFLSKRAISWARKL